jgi:cell division control protein 6
LDNIFKRALSGQSLFSNRDALSSDYIPIRLPFRENQIIGIGEILSPILHGSRPSNLLLYGKTGSGKTAVARYVLRRLKGTAAEQGIGVNICYVNTRFAGTEYRVLSNLAEALNLKIPFTGLSAGEAFARVESAVDASKSSVVMILDEIDFLVSNYGDDIVYELTRVNERLNPSRVSIIGISNDLRFKELLDPRCLSSLSEEEMVFSPYTANELKTILAERAAAAFCRGAVDEAAIGLCAALAGSEHGDARRAVDLLRVAGEVAERETASRVEEKHVRAAAQRIERDRMVEAIRSLPLHAKLVLLSVLMNGVSASTGEIYQRYTKQCRRIATEPLTQRRISGLLAELDLLGLVSANLVSQGRYGRTKKISSLTPIDACKEILSEDSTLRSLLT